MRSEFSESCAVVGAEDIVAPVEKDLIDVEGQILVSLNSPLNAYEENKRVRRQAQPGNLRVKQTEMVGVAKRCLI